MHKKLYNGVEVPVLVFGTDMLREKDGIEEIVYNAIKLGYRHIDTAEIYHNERPIGRAIKRCIEEGIVKREDLFITTKAPFSRPGYENTLAGFQESLDRLGLDYIDLYLIHHPFREINAYRERIVQTWRAMEKLYEDGKIRAIGVSNFSRLHLNIIKIEAEILPMINQIELHPQHQQKEVVKWCKENGIALEGWGTLNQGRIFKNETFKSLAQKYNKTISQIAIRWSVQKGYIPIARSSKIARIEENLKVFDFEISKEDMDLLDSLDGGEFSNWHFDKKIPKEEFKPSVYTRSYKLFNLIPILSIKRYHWSKTKVFLFGFIPFLKISTKDRV